MAYDVDQLATFARSGAGPVGWLVFLATAAGDPRSPEQIAVLGGFHPGSGTRAARELLQQGILVRSGSGLAVATAFFTRDDSVSSSGQVAWKPAAAVRPEPEPPPLLVNGPDDQLRPAGTADPDPVRSARWRWVCDLIDRTWSDRDLGYNLRKWENLGYDPIQLYQAVRVAMGWPTAPRSVKAFIGCLNQWAADPPPIAAAELPPELGGTLGTHPAVVVKGSGPAVPTPAARPDYVAVRRDQMRRAMDAAIPDDEPAPKRPEGLRAVG